MLERSSTVVPESLLLHDDEQIVHYATSTILNIVALFPSLAEPNSEGRVGGGSGS